MTRANQVTDLLQTEPGFIKDWADRVKQLGLTPLVVLLLEAHKPLGFIAGQFVVVGQPLFNLILPPPLTRNAIDLLSNRAYLEQFITELEQD